MIQLPTYEDVYSIDISHLGNEVIEKDFRDYFLDIPSREHYKLLGFFANFSFRNFFSEYSDKIL